MPDIAGNHSWHILVAHSYDMCLIWFWNQVYSLYFKVMGKFFEGEQIMT
jgi:hypothetical protein